MRGLPAAVRQRSSVSELTSAVGGGSLPGETLPSVGLVVAGPRRGGARGAAADGRPGRSSAGSSTARSCSTCGRSSRRDDDALWPRRLAGAPGGGTVMTVVVGTAGHIDHGKTTLLRALTGIDADRLPEERRAGMTIDVGYAHLALADGTELDFVDVPGHDRLVGNMLVGAGEIDAAMLVVAADDGPRAQTLEHLALLDALAIRHGLAVVTKTDLAGPERTAEVVAGRRAAARRHVAVARSPVLAASAIDGTGDRRAAGGAGGSARPDPRRSAGRSCAATGSRLADRSRLCRQGSWRRRDRARSAGGPSRRNGASDSCRATGPSASARSRSTAPPVERAGPGPGRAEPRRRRGRSTSTAASS